MSLLGSNMFSISYINVLIRFALYSIVSCIRHEIQSMDFLRNEPENIKINLYSSNYFLSKV